MTNHGKGWVLFLAALGMMLALESVEIANINTWQELSTPGFVAKFCAHLGTVIAAFVGGKLIPSEDK